MLAAVQLMLTAYAYIGRPSFSESQPRTIR